MAKNSGPVQRAGRQAVVILPQHIDVPSTGQIREELLTPISRGTASPGRTIILLWPT